MKLCLPFLKVSLSIRSWLKNKNSECDNLGYGCDPARWSISSSSFEILEHSKRDTMDRAGQAISLASAVSRSNSSRFICMRIFEKGNISYWNIKILSALVEKSWKFIKFFFWGIDFLYNSQYLIICWISFEKFCKTAIEKIKYGRWRTNLEPCWFIVIGVVFLNY